MLAASCLLGGSPEPTTHTPASLNVLAAMHMAFAFLNSSGNDRLMAPTAPEFGSGGDSDEEDGDSEDGSGDEFQVDEDDECFQEVPLEPAFPRKRNANQAASAGAVKPDSLAESLYFPT